MQQLLADIQSGIRMLVKYPTLSLVAVLTLGLGIGLSTTVFCVVNGGLFKGLPFKNADRMLALFANNLSQGQPRRPVSVQDIPIWKERQTSFDVLEPVGVTPLNLATPDGRPERVSAGQMPVAAFQMLGVSPIIGRGFQEGDDKPSAPPVMLIGYDLWQQKYGGAPDVIGRSVRAGGVYRTVIGVMPENFGFPFRESVWVPLAIEPLAFPRGQGPSYQLLARLKPGVSLEEAQAQVRTIAAQLEREFPDSNKGVGADVMPYTKVALGPEIFGLLMTMLGAGIGVLLIACVNVSNLLVARASLRQREVAVRIALGAGRGRIVRQHLTEVLVLAVAGGVIGVVISILGMRWFTQALSVNPPPFWITFDLDYRVMLFVAGIIGLACV
ncbi:MAG TPA: ABC transporter permease, partial [Vicinamibacterales bacterium]